MNSPYGAERNKNPVSRKGSAGSILAPGVRIIFSII